MKIHPICSALPAMADDEFAALKENIRLHGVMVPAVVHDGQIVDGRHRAQACEELGVECPTVAWDQRSSLVEFVLATNVHRRHLTVGQKAATATLMLPYYEADARERQRTHGGTAPGRPADTEREAAPSAAGKAAAHAASAVGVSTRSVESAKLVQTRDPEAFEKVRAGTKSLNRAVRELRERFEATAAATTPSHTASNGRPASSAVDPTNVEPESVACIIAGLPLGGAARYGDGLADLAKHVLQPGGVLLAIVSQEHLPVVMARLSRGLTYVWTLACVGGSAVDQVGGQVRSSWRSILVFAKGEYAGAPFSDVLGNAVQDKSLDLSARGVKDLLERFTRAGECAFVAAVAADAVIGAAERLGRRAIRVNLAGSTVETVVPSAAPSDGETVAVDPTESVG